MACNRMARALYPFAAQQSEELSFQAGEILTIVNQEANEGWIQARNEQGAGGFIPANYVEFLSMPEPQMPPPPPPSDIYVEPEESYTAANQHRGLPRQETNEYDDWDDDEWDEEDGSRRYQTNDTGPPPPRALSVSGPPGRPVSTMSTVSEAGGGGSARYTTVRKGFGRSFARSGGDEFLLGIKDSEYMKINDEDKMAVIVNASTGLLEWQRRGDPYQCSIGSPKKQSKMKGMKTFIAYTIEPTFSGIRVSRRYKHFDWLHKRLAEKFICCVVPPLPEKQVTGRHDRRGGSNIRRRSIGSGRYEDEFIESRMRQLQMWVNRMTMHPIISNSDVFRHFLTCTDERMWKSGKRKAEKDELQGAKFFFNISTPDLALDWDSMYERSEKYETFISEFDKANKHLSLVLLDNAKKQENHFKKEFQKVGEAFIGLTKAFELDPDNRCERLTAAVHRTGQTYNEIGLMFSNQPRKDADPLMDSLNEYSGILSCMPGILSVQKGAATTVRETRRGFEEDKIERSDHDCITDRAQTISLTMSAEINLFQSQRGCDYKAMMQNYLREQIAFYKEITQKLEGALSQFEKS